MYKANTQKVVNIVNMQNPREGELPGSPRGVLGSTYRHPDTLVFKDNCDMRRKHEKTCESRKHAKSSRRWASWKPQGSPREPARGAQQRQIGTPGDPWGVEILRAHCFQYDLGGFSGESYRRRATPGQKHVFWICHILPIRFRRVIDFGGTAVTLKKRPICSEKQVL